VRIVVDGAKRLECSRELPWGPSVCINEVRLSSVQSNATVRLEVEMQSGDVLVVVGSSASLDG
jgi:hypothetical protein